MLQVDTPVGMILEQYHIESAGPSADPMLRQIQRSELNHLGLFADRHRLRRPSEHLGSTALDLDEHQHAAIFRDKVQLTRRETNVSPEDLEPFSPEIVFRPLLTLISQLTA